MWMMSLPLAYTSCAQPTAQYGQILVPTLSASSSRGRHSRERVDSAAVLLGSSPANCLGTDQSWNQRVIWSVSVFVDRDRAIEEVSFPYQEGARARTSFRRTQCIRESLLAMHDGRLAKANG